MRDRVSVSNMANTIEMRSPAIRICVSNLNEIRKSWNIIKIANPQVISFALKVYIGLDKPVYSERQISLTRPHSRIRALHK